MLAEQCNAASGNGHHLAADEAQHQIDIVNHQVVYDADVGAATAIGASAHAFDVFGGAQVWLYGRPARVEALDMSDLQDQVVAFGNLDQSVGLIGRGRQGFFDQYVNACAQQSAGYVVVIDGGSSDDSRIHLPDERFKVFKGRQLQFGGYMSTGCGHRLDDADNFQMIVALGQACMDLAQMPAPITATSACSRCFSPIAPAAVTAQLRVFNEFEQYLQLWHQLATGCENRISRACSMPTRER